MLWNTAPAIGTVREGLSLIIREQDRRPQIWILDGIRAAILLLLFLAAAGRRPVCAQG